MRICTCTLMHTNAGAKQALAKLGSLHKIRCKHHRWSLHQTRLAFPKELPLGRFIDANYHDDTRPPRLSPLFSAICDSFGRLGRSPRGRRPVESRFRLFLIPGLEGLAFPTEKVDVTSSRLSKPIVWPGVAGVCSAAPALSNALPRLAAPITCPACRGGGLLCSNPRSKLFSVSLTHDLQKECRYGASGATGACEGFSSPLSLPRTAYFCSVS